MDRKLVFGALALLSFAATLFSPADSKLWVYFLMVGIILGIFWFKS